MVQEAARVMAAQDEDAEARGAVHEDEDLDINFAQRLFVAGVGDLEAAEAFADLHVEFVGVGGFGFGEAAAGDFDEDVGALVFRRESEDVVLAGGEHDFHALVGPDHAEAAGVPGDERKNYPACHLPALLHGWVMTGLKNHLDIFAQCVGAIRANKLIVRANRQDKEFHFQNWFADRLSELRLNHEAGGRNTYPDFRLVRLQEGFEIKGLAYPGREANYDCNSQVPSGEHNGRTIYYVFGRYPSEPDGNKYPVLDLVMCHGDFLNATHEYVHKNRSVKGFGSYGDIMIRDRKMYVAPTPFGLTSGTAHHQTLILPAEAAVDVRYEPIGELLWVEADRLIVGYTFDLRTNTLTPETVSNPQRGREHLFRAYRLAGHGGDPVTMRTKTTNQEDADDDSDDE